MKKRYRAAAALALVVMQLFLLFVPVSAADETTATTEEPKGTWIEKSFSSTTILEDFATTLSADQLLEKYPLDTWASKNTASIISVITRKESGTRDMAIYLYIYVPSGTQNFIGGTVAISAADLTDTLSLTMKKVDATATLLKTRIGLTSAQYNAYAVDGAYEIILDSFTLIWGTAAAKETYTYDAINQMLEGGKLGSEIILTLDASGKPTSWAIEEALKLDVYLTSERFSTPENDEYSQLNTAIFRVPTTYFYDESEKYKTLREIVYQAAYYYDVPMLVYEAEDLMSVYDDIHIIGDIETVFDENLLHWWPSYKYFDYVEQISYPALPIREFAFYIPEIVEEAYGGVDVSSEVLLAAYEKAKANWASSNYGRPFSTYIRAGRYHPLQVYTAKATDKLKTESYADGASWLTKLCGGWRIFGENIDDSIEVDAIQTYTLEDYVADYESGPPNLGRFPLSSRGTAYLQDLINETFSGGSNEYTIVLMHYAITPYRVYAVDGYELYSGERGYFSEHTSNKGYDAYVAMNTIVSDFKIIEMHYESEDRISVVPVAMPTMVFVAELEGDEALKDETYDPPDLSWLDWFDFSGPKSAIDKVFGFFRLVGLLILAALAVWGCTKIFKFIAAARDAFGRRGGGKGGGGSG